MNNSYELAQKYADFKLPEDVLKASKVGIPLIGSLAFTKMMMFANEIQITNDDIDYYMGIPPQRQEGESYDEMKTRNKFAKKLLKFRPYLYDYSVYTPVKKMKQLAKQMAKSK